jgi:deazaflavin-dependent oxidoreductase (nitroreductase family)
MNGNSFVILLLRSPLHPMLSGSTLLITVTGRKTGRQLTTPVNYYRDGDTLWVVTQRDRTWWRNLRGGAPVQLRLRGQAVSGMAEIVLDPEAVARQLGRYVQEIPMSARALGIHVVDGEPNAEDLNRAAQSRVFARIQVCGPVIP